jgi:hypothetical protein
MPNIAGDAIPVARGIEEPTRTAEKRARIQSFSSATAL